MYKRILVPIDGSPTSSRGLDEALALARLTGASLRLVHVVDQWTFTAGCETYTPDIMEILLADGRKILDAATCGVWFQSAPVFITPGNSRSR